MMEFLTYLLEVNIGFSFVFLFYLVFFRLLPFFNYNRFLLLTIALSSLILPFLSFNLTEGVVGFLLLPQVVVNSSEVVINSVIPGTTTQGLLFGIYVTIAFFLLVRFIVQLSKLLVFLKSRTGKKIDNINEIQADVNQPTFSFLNYIHIHPNDLHEAVRVHEMTHIRGFHTVDILFLRIFQIFNWFNPLAFIAIKVQRLTHEFQADERAVEQLKNTKEYCELLLRKIKEPSTTKLAHSFSLNTNLKPRIMKLTNNQSKKRQKWCYLLMIPVFAIAVAFVPGKSSDDNYTAITPEVAVEKDTVYQKVDQMPVFGSGMQDLIKYLGENIKYPSAAEKDGATGKVFISFIVADNGKVENVEVLKSVREDMDNEALRVISAMPAWSPGIKDGKKVNVKMVLPIVFNI